jgi:hypothetical protein
MSATWIAAHATNYLDPEIVGVSGSEVLEPATFPWAYRRALAARG